MKRMTPLVTATAMTFASWAVFAQQPEPATPPEGAQQQPQAGGEQQLAAVDVTEQELETFADIYVELEETVTKYETEMSAVETEQEAQDVQTRLQQESFEKIAERGWTPEKFNMVVQAVNADPALLERALVLIEDRS